MQEGVLVIVEGGERSFLLFFSMKGKQYFSQSKVDTSFTHLQSGSLYAKTNTAALAGVAWLVKALS